MALLPSYRRSDAPRLTLRALLRSRYALLIFLLPFIVFVLWIHPPSRHFLNFGETESQNLLRVVQTQAYHLASQKARPTCHFTQWHQSRYTSLAPREDTAPKNIFLAMNFMNNEDVLPTFFQELPIMLNHLGPERVFVSVFENGSNDKTPDLLHLLDILLTGMNTPHKIVSRGQADIPNKENGARIVVLAAARNAALEPLYSGEAAKLMPGGSFHETMFMNDICHCAVDMLEVLYQKRMQGANQACAVDWGGQVVYDRWIIRTMAGRTFYFFQNLVDYFNGDGPKIIPPVLQEEDATRERFKASLPMQVFSCWNGATIFDAVAFLPPHNIRFRVAHNDFDENGNPKTVTEKASECFLTSVDMWKAGMGKIMIVPRASVAYGHDDYGTYRKDSPPSPSPDPAEEKISWVLKPPAQVMHQDYAVWYEPERWGPWNEA